MRRIFWLLLVNLCLLLVAAFLSWKNGHVAGVKADEMPVVVAKVNGFPLYSRDLLSAAGISKNHPENALLRTVLKQMILGEIVRQHAINQPIGAAEIEEVWRTVTDQFVTDAQLSAALAKAGLTLENAKKRSAENLQAEHWLRTMSFSEPAAGDISAWQLAHPEAFMLPEVVEATHFAAIFPPQGQVNDFLAKGDLIQEVQARLKKGIPLDQLIETLSDDPAKKMTHGSLGWFTKNRMEPELSEAAFRLPPGVISLPIQTRFGFHLLTVSEHRPASVLASDEALNEARLRVGDEIQLKKLQALLAELRQRAEVEILDPNLREPSL